MSNGRADNIEELGPVYRDPTYPKFICCVVAPFHCQFNYSRTQKKKKKMEKSSPSIVYPSITLYLSSLLRIYVFSTQETKKPSTVYVFSSL
jgi:hypothetical protein